MADSKDKGACWLRPPGDKSTGLHRWHPLKGVLKPDYIRLPPLARRFIAGLRLILRALEVFPILTLFFLAACSGKTPAITPTSDTTPKAITVKNQQGFPLSLRSVFRQGDNIRTVFCFILPTSDDWQLGQRANDVVLFAGDLSSVRSSGGLLFDDQKQGSDRCLSAVFPTPGWPDVSQVRITVLKIATSMPEGPDCVKAQEKLKIKGIAITIVCKPGDHSFLWDVVSRPETMSSEKAREVAYDEGLVDTIFGPWTFTTPFFAASAE